jgi:hypothetical protein
MMKNINTEMNGKQIKNGGPPRKCYSIEVNIIITIKVIVLFERNNTFSV